MYTIKNLTSQTGHVATETKGIFTIVEHDVDYSVSPANAQTEYFMSRMNVKRRQTVVNLDGSVGLILQAGAMQWMAGDVQATTGLKGVGDFLGKMVKGAVTKEAAIKRAEGEAEAILKVQQATAEALKLLTQAAPSDQVVKLKALEAFQKAADGKATKLIIPSEIQGLAGLAASAMEILDAKKDEEKK